MAFINLFNSLNYGLGTYKKVIRETVSSANKKNDKIIDAFGKVIREKKKEARSKELNHGRLHKLPLDKIFICMFIY